jgi:FkbM family methyltransferase
MLSKVRSRLRRALIRRLNAPDMTMALERLAGLGFSPELIFDVGAFRGDFAKMALAIWPSARIACFEPLPHGVQQIEALRNTLPGIDIHHTLVGATEKAAVEIHMENSASSVLHDAYNHLVPVQAFPQTTLDVAVRDKYAGRAPDLLKIDTQGYELEVLKGAEASLSRIRVVLAEINLLDLHENVPLLHELVSWLAERNFVAYDICGFGRRPLDNALWQADFIFVKKDDALRRDKGFFVGRSEFRA